MISNKKVVRFMVNRHDGATQYDRQIDIALRTKLKNFSYIVQDIKDYKSLPRFMAFIFFWFRAQYLLFFGNFDVVIGSPWIMLIYPKSVSIISVSHHYDPSIFRGIKMLYVKFAHWLFMTQKSRIDLVVSCSKYWSQYYKEKGFKKTLTIYNGFDIKFMDNSLSVLENKLVLNKYNLKSKKYLHLGSYGHAKGQKIAVMGLKEFDFPMVATCSYNVKLIKNLEDVQFINANFQEYNVLLKNAKAVICMSEFKEGWCRVLHEAAIHGTPIIGSGLGGMEELLDIGEFMPSTIKSLSHDLNKRINQGSISNEKLKSFRAFTLERFNKAWQNCIYEFLDA